MRHAPIVVKDARALINFQKAGKSLVSNTRVDVHTDSLSFLQSWQNQTADRLAQLIEYRTTVREVAGSSLGRTNSQGL